jgi:serine/threonine protein phosphatase PrpC
MTIPAAGTGIPVAPVPQYGDAYQQPPLVVKDRIFPAWFKALSITVVGAVFFGVLLGSCHSASSGNSDKWDKQVEANCANLHELMRELRGRSLQDLMAVSAKHRDMKNSPIRQKQLKTQRERNANFTKQSTFANYSEQETDVPNSSSAEFTESCSEVDVEAEWSSEDMHSPIAGKYPMPTLPEDDMTLEPRRTRGVVVASTTDKDLNRRGAFEDKDMVLESEDPNDVGVPPIQISRAIGLGIACKKGMKHAAPNQDSFSVVVMPGHFKLLGVYDGHGPHGHHVSQFVKENLPKLFFKYLAATSAPEHAMTNAFKDVQQLLWRATLDNQLDAQQSGSTATIAYIPEGENTVVVAHVGDSRAIIVGTTGHRDLTMDHKPTILAERQRIERNGGEVRRDRFMQERVFIKGQRYPGINMSRALGDLWAQRKAGLSAVPEVNTVSLEPTDTALVLASDGVWEFVDSSHCAASIRGDLLKTRDDDADCLQAAADQLARQSWEYWMQDTGSKESDDITALCIRLNPSSHDEIASEP